MRSAEIELRSAGHEAVPPDSTLDVVPDLPFQHHSMEEISELYRGLFELASDFAFLIRVNPDGSRRVEWITEAYYRWLGLSRQELDVQSLRALVHPDDDLLVQSLLEEVLAGRSSAREVRLVSRSGEIRWVSFRCRALLDEVTGRVTAILGAGRDCTEIKAAGEAQSRLAAIVDSSTEAIISKDLNGIITSWNAGAERLYGYAPKEAIGHPISIIVPPERDEEEHRIRERIARGEQIQQLQTDRRRKDGAVRTVMVTISPIRNDRTDIVGASAIARDVSEHKSVEENLRRALQQEREAGNRLRALDDMKNAFLTAVSHELRTPLASVLGSALTLERLEPELSEQERVGLMRAVSANARKLQRMLHDLLDLDRLTRGVLAPRREAEELGALVRGVVEASDFLDGRRVEIESHAMVFPVDAPKVERIVENLLANSVRYTAPGTPIWVIVRRVPEGAIIAVEDVGPGVPEELRERIFEPFQQGEKVRANSPGVGIGLSLVARFAELHEGRAWVDPRPGGGSSFKVLLREPTAPRLEEAR